MRVCERDARDVYGVTLCHRVYNSKYCMMYDCVVITYAYSHSIYPIPLYAGGRMREGKDRPGSVLLGARTIQEGGAFLDVTREEVCVYMYMCVG